MGQKKAMEKLEILKHRMTRGKDSVNVYGTAKNISDSTLKYAQVETRFYDAKGKKVGQHTDEVKDLAAGESWEFRGGMWEYDLKGKPIKIKSYEIKVLRALNRW